MIVIGLSDCPGCEIFHAKHPELPFVEMPRKIGVTKDLQPIKKALGRLGVTEFPVILDDMLSQVIPMEEVDKEFADAMNGDYL